MTNRFDDISQEDRERLLRFTKKVQTKSLPFLKWADAPGVSSEYTFRINGKSVIHSQWIARADEAVGCHVRFGGKALLGKSPSVLLLQCDPERPKTYTDRNEWPKSDFGDYKKDPWQLQLEIPLQHIETGELAAFSSSTEWGRTAIAAMVEHFIKTSRRPIVQLEKREKTDSGKTYHVGVFDIVTSDEGDDAAVDLTKDAVVNEPVAVTNGSGASDGASSGASKNSDMDDDIPF